MPDWLRQPAPEVPPGRADRLRIALGGHSGKLLGGVLVLALLAFFGLVGGLGYQGFQRWREISTAYPTTSPPSGEQAVSSASPPPAAGPFDGTPRPASPGCGGDCAAPGQADRPVHREAGGRRSGQGTQGPGHRPAGPYVLHREEPGSAGAPVRPGHPRQHPEGLHGRRRRQLRHPARARHPVDERPALVQGRISYRATRDAYDIRVLEITSNFVWVYAARSTRAPSVSDVILVHDTVIWEVPSPGGRRHRLPRSVDAGRELLRDERGVRRSEQGPPGAGDHADLRERRQRRGRPGRRVRPGPLAEGRGPVLSPRGSERDGYPDWLDRLEREIRPSLAVRLRIWCRRRARRLMAALGVVLLLAAAAGAAGYGHRQPRRPAAAPSPRSPALRRPRDRRPHRTSSPERRRRTGRRGRPGSCCHRPGRPAASPAPRCPPGWLGSAPPC
ncbi:hypothetical protein V2I01_23330 [Micromonospora sp. BRA006-A]|nr:hypothetical protein [Micromonospora sp. BRA006-A]